MSVINVRTPGDAFIWAVRSTFNEMPVVCAEAASFWLVPGTFDHNGDSVL